MGQGRDDDGRQILEKAVAGCRLCRDEIDSVEKPLMGRFDRLEGLIHRELSFTYPTGGKEGAAQVLKILKGEAVPKNIIIESEMVTIENVEQVKPVF